MSEVCLRALEPDDFRETHKWRLDDGTWDHVVGMKRFVSLETERKWVINAIEKHEHGSVFRFVISEDRSGVALGLITVASVDYVNRSCSISYMVSPEHRGRGLASKGVALALSHLFLQVGMQRVCCNILADNAASRKLAKKSGLVEEGVLRKAVFKTGLYHDLICCAILREDWHEV